MSFVSLIGTVGLLDVYLGGSISFPKVAAVLIRGLAPIFIYVYHSQTSLSCLLSTK